MSGPSGEQTLSTWEAPIGVPGGYVLALTVKPRFIELKPADFLRYLTEEEFKHEWRSFFATVTFRVGK